MSAILYISLAVLAVVSVASLLLVGRVAALMARDAEGNRALLRDLADRLMSRSIEIHRGATAPSPATSAPPESPFSSPENAGAREMRDLGLDPDTKDDVETWNTAMEQGCLPGARAPRVVVNSAIGEPEDFEGPAVGRDDDEQIRIRGEQFGERLRGAGLGEAGR